MKQSYVERQMQSRATAPSITLQHALSQLGYQPAQRITEHGHVLHAVIEVGGRSVAIESEPASGYVGLMRKKRQLRGWLAIRLRQLQHLSCRPGAELLVSLPVWELERLRRHKDEAAVAEHVKRVIETAVSGEPGYGSVA